MCGGDMSPYPIMSVARNMCSGPDKRSVEGAEIEMLKARRGGKGMGRGCPPPQPTRRSGGVS